LDLSLQPDLCYLQKDLSNWTHIKEQGTGMRMNLNLIATLACLPTLMTTPLPGSSNNDMCQYNCLDKGVCEVLYIGPPRGGNTKGSCFPARFGGGCRGSPPECQECNRVINCENSPEPEPVLSFKIL